MNAQRFDPTQKKMRPPPLSIPQEPEMGVKTGGQRVVPKTLEAGADNEERYAKVLRVPPPTPVRARRDRSRDARRVDKSMISSPVTSPGVPFPTPTVPGFATTDVTLLDSVAYKFPSPTAGEAYSPLPSAVSDVGTPDGDHVDRKIIRPTRSRLSLKRSFGNLKKACSTTTLRKTSSGSTAHLPPVPPVPPMPGSATLGLDTSVYHSSSNDTLASAATSISRLPSPRTPKGTASLSSPVALNEVSETLRKLASRLDLRDCASTANRHFDETVEYYERTWARAETGEGRIEVCVKETKETFAGPHPHARPPRATRPDGIGLYAQPRSRKNTMPHGDVRQ